MRRRSRCGTHSGPCATTGYAPRARCRRLAGRDAGEGALAAYLAIQQAFSALDRLEVRGRDSAGIHVFVHDHGLDLSDAAVQAPLASGRKTRHSSRVPSASSAACLSFVYKAAAEIGELGDNTRVLRAAVASDDSCDAPWAPRRRARGTRAHSMGERRHHLRAQRPSDQQRRARARGRRPVPRRRAQRRRRQPRRPPRRARLRIHAQITTDAKVIPALVSRHMAAGHDEVESFRRTVAAFDGSVAIAAMARQCPIRCCSPSAVAARACTSGSPTTRSSSPASPTAWSRRRSSTFVSTARRR